ncbi:uncharacterized protein LOC134214246 [Armigeres subalbatus]|uniref:uncharacterized protein LOC134214246 n=1 Tax=Armigeres subalbatus TaxID=124917 RepID=UPI002ED5B65F
MKYYLAVVCALGFFYGAVFANLEGVNVGAQGLITMSSGFRSLSPVMTAFYKSLNKALNQINSAFGRVQTLVNSTYQTLNDTYGATQPSLASVMSSMDWFGQQFHYAEQQFESGAGYDVYVLDSELQQTMDKLLQYYGLLVTQRDQGSCTLEISNDAINLPNQLTKFGSSCLQTYVNIMPTLVNIVLEISDIMRSDFNSLTKQLKICASTSTNCINEYFSGIYNELNYINSEFYIINNLLSVYQNDLTQRDYLCGGLVKYNVQYILDDLMNRFLQCQNAAVVY